MNTLIAAHNDPYVQAFPELVQFWEATARGEFLLPRCRDCGQCHWHPRAICPFCGSAEIGWITSTGKGEVYSFSIIRQRDKPAYILAYIFVEEGIQLMSNVVDCDPEIIRIGMLVNVSFMQTQEGRYAPVFHPACAVNES